MRYDNKEEVTCYLAGKMTGIKDFNYAEFGRVAGLLHDMFGFVVQNPADNFGGYQYLDHDQYIRMAIPQVMACDILVLHGDWETSPGACTEAAVAFLCGRDVYVLNFEQDALDGFARRAYLRRIKSMDVQLANIRLTGRDA